MSSHNTRTTWNKGFTLIELLVVISIIAMLLAILMPVLGRVKSMARRSICLSNQRQCILACVMYASDYNSWLPKGNVGPTDDSPEIWTNTNFDSCLDLYQSYGVTEDLAMCSSWLKNIDDFFVDPTEYGDDVYYSQTTIGFVYYGRRYDKPSEQYSPKTSLGSYYKSPAKLTDSKNKITSQTLLTCYHWDSISPEKGQFGAKLPHTNSGKGIIIDNTAGSIKPAPQGLAVGMMDASVSWVKWENLKYFEQNQEIRVYYAQ